MIRIGLPKGRMASESASFCGALGIRVRPGVLRYRTVVRNLDVAILLLKAPDVARLLRRNLLELGLTGDEWLMETGTPPGHRCFETRSYAASVCLLTAEDDPRPPARIRSVATPYPNLARRLLSGTAPDADIITVSGSSEALVPGIADACFDLVETGTSAALNSLAVRRCFANVTTHLVRSELCDPATVAPVLELLADVREAV
ncbi:MAG: ATP phosphoribosyltransferase [Streptosporangiaceae bacterium]